jgi:hypothetical protein|tara:strand:+ start:1372 stop:1605 length:234 start_codon:yes stop_codon:yes gene_type:complete
MAIYSTTAEKKFTDEAAIALVPKIKSITAEEGAIIFTANNKFTDSEMSKLYNLVQNSLDKSSVEERLIRIEKSLGII